MHLDILSRNYCKKEITLFQESKSFEWVTEHLRIFAERIWKNYDALLTKLISKCVICTYVCEFFQPSFRSKTYVLLFLNGQ